MKTGTPTIRNERGEVFHEVGGAYMQCGGLDCVICKSKLEEDFQDWEASVPIPIPKKGKHYKKKRIQKNRGKSILEICYTCREIPCYVCRRNECEQWQKETHRKGQEDGCSHWENGRCNEFFCEKGLIKTTWHD